MSEASEVKRENHRESQMNRYVLAGFFLIFLSTVVVIGAAVGVATIIRNASIGHQPTIKAR